LIINIPLLNDIVIIFALAILVVYLCQKLRIPSVVGLLITGVLAGPHGLGLVGSAHDVEVMAELGVILLLFTIGIEFSLGRLLEIRKSVLLGGSLQVMVTTLITMVILLNMGRSMGEAVFTGFLVSLSSTAVVLKVIQDRSEIDAPYGRSTLGILIFQDIIIIPMMIFTPILANSSAAAGESLWLLLIKVVLILLMLFVGAKWVAPFVFYHIARQRNRELFLISIVTMCLAVAWFTSSLGLSVSLGAFLAGLIISESEYSHQALGNILPFKDVFTSIFFVSIGMLLNIGVFWQQPGLVILITLAILLGKAVISGSAALALGLPLRTAVLTGLALSQVGEFSFILSRYGMEYQLINDSFNQLFMAVSVLTMAVTPFIIGLSPRVAEGILKLPLPVRLKTGVNPGIEITEDSINDHLIIIGFGINGKNLARAASASGIPYVIIESNPDAVKDGKQNGEPIFYGDATQFEVLQHSNVKDARVAVIAISDPAAAVRITDLIRRLNDRIHIIVRTRYIQEIQPLYQVGANDVIPEEFETSVEIFTLVLKKYLVPKVDIDNFIAQIRSDGYEMLRSLSRRSPSLQDIKLHYHDAEIMNIRIEKGAWVVGRTLAQIDLRSRYGGSVLLIQRGSETLVNPGGDDLLEADDQAVVLGSPEILDEIVKLFSKTI
jgi:Kef-type K+ transport system, predicted NAD-binding component